MSVALVSRAGKTLLGSVYDPVSETLYHALDGGGCFKEAQSLSVERTKSGQKIQVFADRSLRQASNYDELQKLFEIMLFGKQFLAAGFLMRCTSSTWLLHLSRSLNRLQIRLVHLGLSLLQLALSATLV